MNEEEFLEVKRDRPSAITLEQLGRGVHRTLLYGYTCARHTWHVYGMNGLIHRLVYDGSNNIVSHGVSDSWDAVELVPDKRVYPESTSGYFARILRNLNVEVPYLPFDPDRYERVKDLEFHGMTVPAGPKTARRQRGDKA